MHIELLTTGSELLLGVIPNDHARWVALELGTLGLRLQRHTTVPDGPATEAALAEALARADLVLVTGGLGPTSDDLTRDIAAKLYDRELHIDAAVRESIAAFFRGRKFTPPATVERQAQVPDGATVLPNAHGTAPGLRLETRGGEAFAPCTTILLPGPPRELHPMWREQVVPWLLEHTGRAGLPPQTSRTWRILGIGESRVEEALEEPLRELGAGAYEIGYCSRPGEVDLRIVTAVGTDLAAADRLIRDTLGDAVYAEGDLSLEAVVVHQAAAAGWQIATAESCTGGLVAHRLTNISGSSAVYGFGWVTYANAAKMQELGVPAALLDPAANPAAPGAVSEEVARAMAEGALAQSGADLAVALTGIAGPTGGSAEKPVGTVWIGLARRDGPTTAKHRLFGVDRETFKYMASQAALDLLRRALPRGPQAGDGGGSGG